MNKSFRIQALVALSLSLIVGALAGSAARAEDPPPTPQALQAAPQHVTVPSLPGQANREGTVQPGGGLKTDEYGNLVQPMGPPPAPTTPPTGSSRATGAKPKSGGASVAPVPAGTAGPAPSGPAVATGQNTARIRGVVKAYEAGKSLTMTVRGTGRDVTYKVKAGAKVPSGLKTGDPVRIHVLTAEKGNVLDGVEILSKP